MALPSIPPDARWAVWLLGVDGIVHSGDVAVQAFARHAGQGCDDDRRRTLIGAMRGFLEGRRGLLPPEVDLSRAQNGREAVVLTAESLGVTGDALGAAERAARVDLAGTAWMLDPAEGLSDLLNHPRVGTVSVVPLPVDDPAVVEVLAAVGVEGRVKMSPAPDWAAVVAAGPVLVIADSWGRRTQAASRAGAAVAVIDRFGRRAGTPDLHVPTMADLVAALDGLSEPGPGRRGVAAPDLADTEQARVQTARQDTARQDTARQDTARRDTAARDSTSETTAEQATPRTTAGPATAADSAGAEHHRETPA